MPQRLEDRVLEVLIQNTKTIQSELGTLTPVVEKSIARLLQNGIIHQDLGKITQSIAQIPVGCVSPNASAIRERIYAGDSGYGILLYTGTSGNDGTLGGLVQIGKRIESLLMGALELGRLCSNHPVCAQHEPESEAEDLFLYGSACHWCLLIAETSCERRNDFLDRALVVNTVSGNGAAFFPDEL